jgi:hypothetical protein
MSTPQEHWWLEEIDGGFVLVHHARGRDVACRIYATDDPEEFRSRLAAEITELRELVHQVDLWVTN